MSLLTKATITQVKAVVVVLCYFERVMSRHFETGILRRVWEG